MEVDEGSKIFTSVLSSEEWSQVPQEIGKKLEVYVQDKFEELITSKALYETKRAESEQTLQKISDELLASKTQNDDNTSKLEVANKTIFELESQISTCTTENAKQQECCNRLESTTAEFRRQRDMAIDERDNLQKMMERRNAEIDRLQSDVSTLSNQLNAAVNSKCEALAKAEEVASMKVTLEYKERHMEQEKSFLNSQIKNLSEDLNKRAAELQNLRHEHTTKLILLETKLSKKSEELRITTENVSSLTVQNKNLSTKAEELNEKIKKQRDIEIKLQDTFNNELLAQTRLAELYKGLNDENNNKVDELKKAITELQGIVRSVSDQYGELETKYKETETEHDEILNKKNECIVLLKKELDTANSMLKLAKEESLHREIENLSPSAATASRILKSGTSLTQIYSQLVTVTEELSIEKDENRRLNAYISKIVQEFEDKTPILQKEREDYEHALETIVELTKHNENMILECHKLRDESTDAKKMESRAIRENERMKKEIIDLSRQVVYLLKEVEASRAASTSSPDHDISLADSLSSADVISKKLVTFRDIQELQETNQKLLALVRELSSKQEEAECMDTASIAALKEKINTLRDSQSEMFVAQERQNRMLENAIRQRDTYRSLCQKSMKLPLEEDIPMDQTSNTESDTQLKVVQDPEKEKKLKEFEVKLADTAKELGQLKDEYDTYKKDKCANEKILVEQVEQLRKDHRELTQMNCKLTSMTEYNEERFKILKQNTEVYRNQITALEEKNKTYNSTIIKHEQSIMHLKDEALNAQTKLSRSEVALQNIQQECRLLRDSESRLLKEKELTNRENQGQSLLLNNLEMIKASLERSEAEGKIRVESRLDEAMRECSALRRRLQEEQDKFRELSSHLEKVAQNAQTRMVEETSQADHLRDELSKTRDELTAKAGQIEELSKKIKNTMLLSRTATEEQRTKELERQLVECQDEILSLKQQLAISKESIAQYCNISECAEKELKDEHERFAKYKETTDSQLLDNNNLISELREKVSELDTELSLQSSGQAETTIELKAQLGKIRDELQIAVEELEISKSSLETARQEIKALSASVQVAEDKYTREMMLHSTDLQALTTLKEELVRVSSELNEMRHEREQAVDALSLSKSGWEDREKLLEHEKTEINNRLRDLDAQNTVLHDQIQALSTQLSVLHAQKIDISLNQSLGDTSFNRSLTEDDIKSSEQLLQIVKYLRKEKDLAITKFEVLQAENLRLRSQFEMTDKELKETRNALIREREGSEASMVTAAKHEEVLRKVETLNAITDSNKILRDERDNLKMQLRELSTRASSLEEQLAPLQEKNRELSLKAEHAITENQALRAEATRWRQRANALTEKANKISPEDWRRLQNEREGLAKMLSTEKDAHRRLLEECNNVKNEKSRLEDHINNISLQNRNQAKELKRHVDELNGIKLHVSRLSQELIEAREIAAQRTEENTKITEDLAAKDVVLADTRAKETQVRKIAKKYKTQYEELYKAMEDEKQKADEIALAQANQIIEVPLEVQENYREEGRKELEIRITEIERQHNERLDELNAQVSSSHEEMETLKSENSVLKSNESEKDERTKLVLKAAKMKITELTEERNRVRRELNELRNRVDSNDSNKDDVRIIRLEKEKSDAIAERQQDRERLTRDIDSLNQRINQLQRQLGLPPASKPSTSSGSLDKSGSDPPTANIKPMSGGHSNTQQQSATIMPWRGNETPFASIRPMAQLRTVAVLPTSQNSGSSSPSTAVLVPPQQQIVHTTGNSSIEVMSSSPTSSHTDYMPATSSASPAIAPIRQVVVPPTQQATIGMSSREEPPSAAESTQDEETENQQPVMQIQQAVAMVLPRVEQQSSSSQTQNIAEQSTSTSVAVVASSQQASSSNTVTTTQAGHKRPRETEGDSSTQNDEQQKVQPLTKRTRTQPSTQEIFQVGVTESGVEVEYQVPTSSQRDQEDDVIVLSEDEGDGPDEGEADAGEGEEEGIMMEADDDAPFEESGDVDGDGYEMEALAYEQEQELAYDDADCQDMVDDSETAADPDDVNNEVEIIDDSSEVPNQSGSSSSISAAPEQSGVGGSNGEGTERGNATTAGAGPQPGASQSEAISSGSEGTSGVTLSQATPSMTIFQRSRNVTPLSRQQQSHLLLPHGFEETGDDGIVPSTPTLYVPRRTDGFGEAVSSPHVPSGRFTFSDAGAAAPRGAGIAQVGNEGIDDTRVDLSQLDDSGTGRSVPSTPLQVSPQGDQPASEGNAEVAPSGDSAAQQTEQAQDDIPAITVTEAGEEAETSHQETDSRTAQSAPEGVAGPSSMGVASDGNRPGSASGVNEEGEELLEGEEGMDGVSSEGEKVPAVEDSEIEESREAEASETPSSNTRSRSGNGRGSATARRSSRGSFRSRTPHRPTPIVWNRGESSRGGMSGQQPEIGDAGRARGILPENSIRGSYPTRHRARRMRQLRGPFGRF